MANIIYARVMQKTATLDEWMSSDLVLLDGEQAFVVGSDGSPINFKIGDGTKTFSELPFWIQYDQAQYIAVDSNSLPTPTQDVGYSLVGSGTYTKAGQADVVVPSGHMGILNWDGSEWYLGSSVEMPTAPVASLINPEAVGEAVNSWAVLDRVQKRTGTEGYVNATPVIHLDEHYVNHGGFQSSNEFECSIYSLEEDLYLSTETDAYQARFVWLLDNDFRSSNSSANGYIYLPANTSVSRMHLSVENLKAIRPTARFVGITRSKAKGDTVVETAPSHKGISDRLKNKLVKAPVINIYAGKVLTAGVSGAMEDDSNYDTYEVLWESELSITFHSAPQMALHAVGVLDQNLTRVVQSVPELGDKQLHGYRVPKPSEIKPNAASTTNRSAAKYLRFSHKKGEPLNIETLDTGSSDWRKFRNFKGRGVLPDLIGETQIGKVIDSNGSITEQDGSILYIVDTKRVLQGTLTLNFHANQTNKFVVVLNNLGEAVDVINVTTSTVIDLAEYPGMSIAFAFDQSGGGQYTIWDIWYREDLSTRVVNVLDYAQNSTAVGYQPNWSIIFNELMKKLNALGGGVIYAPAGVYHFFGDAIEPLSNVSIKGDGEFHTIFKPMQNSFLHGVDIENVVYSDFTVDGEYQDTKGNWQPFTKGFYVQKLRNATFRNLIVKNTSRTGLGCDHFINGLIMNVVAEGCGKDGDLTEPSGAMGCSGIGIGVGAFNRGAESLTIVGCHANNNKQNGIFIEQQGESDHPTGYSVIGCTAEGNRIGFGCSGGDNVQFIGCTAVRNHQSGFSYDNGTLNSLNTTGKNVKYISCITKENGLDLPVDYPEFAGMPNGYGFYVKENFEGVEFIGCESFDNLKSGVLVHKGVSNLNLQGGKFYGNGEDGIELRGEVDKFRISPLSVENNENNGISIDGDLSNGFMKDFIATENKVGINKKSGTLDNVIVKDILAYDNTESDVEGGVVIG